MEICHFNTFLSLTNTDTVLLSSDLEQALMMIHEGGTQLALQSLPPEILDLCSRYCYFTDETKRGEHGKTAKYCTQYIGIVHLYHDLSRSVCESDMDLFIHTIPKRSCFFFACNQPNYAKWMVQYHNNLLRSNESHPDIKFQNRGFGVKRTSNNFSRSPIYLTLGQTDNADAASQRTGIGAFTNSTLVS